MTLRYALYLLLPLLLTASASAQRLQIQGSIGTNFSEAFLHDDALAGKETKTYFDSIGNIQPGLGVNARLYRFLHLRAEANYKNFRMYYKTETAGTTDKTTVLGNLYKENWTISILPECRFNLVKGGRSSISAYGFAGLLFSLEQAKNFSYSNVIRNGIATFNDEIKPDVAPGWSVGAGINPKWRRLGFLLEMRYSRTGAVSEGGVLPEVSFEHFAMLFGLTLDVW